MPEQPEDLHATLREVVEHPDRAVLWALLSSFLMHRRGDPPEVLLAPPASSGSAALKLPGQDGGRPRAPGKDDFPRVDDHVVEPETRQEMVRGERIQAQPARAPHGDRHFRLDYVLGAHVREGYVGSTDLLTRVLHGSDFASDTCIRREGEDPATGQRFLEEVAFEIVYAQPLKKATERAEDWCRRGVRRVFGVFVKKGTVEEFLPGPGTWRPLAPGEVIDDPCLVRPLGVQALLGATSVDDEVARALEAKDNAAILAMKAESEALAGRRAARRELAEAVLSVLAARGIEASPRARTAFLGSEDLPQLRRWLVRAVTVTRADELIDGE